MPENSRSCRRGAELMDSRAQTRERGPSSTWAEILYHSWVHLPTLYSKNNLIICNLYLYFPKLRETMNFFLTFPGLILIWQKSPNLIKLTRFPNLIPINHPISTEKSPNLCQCFIISPKNHQYSQNFPTSSHDSPNIHQTFLNICHPNPHKKTIPQPCAKISPNLTKNHQTSLHFPNSS